VDWLKRRGETLLDNLLWVAVAALVGLVGTSVLTFGVRRFTLHVWEVALVLGLFVVLGVCLGALLLRLRQVEAAPPVPVVAPAAPKVHGALLGEIEVLEKGLEDVPQGTASWEMAQVYHELRERSINAAPTSAALATLPVLRSATDNMADVQVPHLRLYLKRMAGLLEQDEAPAGRRTRATIL
jgi:hypothetical protein